MTSVPTSYDYYMAQICDASIKQVFVGEILTKYVAIN